MTGRSRHWLWLLMLVPIGLGLWRLRFDVEVLNLLPESSAVVQGLKAYQQNFANARELIITLEVPDAALAEPAGRTIGEALRARPDLVSDATWTPPWLERPGQAAELLAYLWLNQPPTEFAALTNHLSGAALTNTLNESREALATSFSPEDLAMRGYDPLGLSRLPETGASAMPGFGSGSEFFASEDGKFRLVFAEAARDLTSYKDCVRWLEEVKRVIEGARSSDTFPASVAVNYTGRPAFVAEIAGGMERDLAGPSVGTLAVIAILFYYAHRRWRPLLWLIALLILILAGTLALGGLVYGTLSVVSLGFASILLGLAEDFAIVLYQESRTHPNIGVRAIRRLAAPGIWWSALTTAGAFLLLNLSSLPGLGQLGTLVAIGVSVAAVVMLFAYLPPLMPKREFRDVQSGAELEHADRSGSSGSAGSNHTERWPTWIATALLVLAGLALLAWRPPVFDQSADSLRPQNSRAYAAVDQIKLRLNRPLEPLWVMIAGKSEADVAGRFPVVRSILNDAVKSQAIASFTLPETLWPHPERQSANRSAALALAQQEVSLREATKGAGFSDNSFSMAQEILRIWRLSAASAGPFWPTNANSRWVLEKVTARKPGQFLCIGLVHMLPSGVHGSFPALASVGAALQYEGVWLSGWELLGPEMSVVVRRDMFQVLLPIFVLVLVTLWLAFRSWRDVALSLATLVMSGLVLHVVMSVAGWSWNMMNLMALPLLLGMGVDFSIHMQLALRRHGGDLAMVRRSVGHALLLAGSTTVAGFGSLAFASNAGIASLGKVCAVGIVCAMLCAVYLLPVWWRTATGVTKSNVET